MENDGEEVTGSRRPKSTPDRPASHQVIDRRAKMIVLFVVVVVWATNFFAGLVVPGYKPDPQVHAVFMIVVGAIFASDFGPRRKGGDGE